MKLFYFLMFLILLFVGFVLAILNSSPVSINYYYGWLDIPLSFALLIPFIAGILLGTSSNLWANFKLRRRYLKLTKQASLAQQEVSNLRTSPIKSIN